MPVEALLQWAYGQQMVHLAQRPTAIVARSGGPLAAYSTLWSDGAVPIDSSVDQGFRASDDAWAIHDLVMAIKPVTLDLGQDLAAARYHALGQYRGHAPPLGRAASADHSAQLWPTDGWLTIDVRGLVMVHANRATRPEQVGGDKLRLKPGEVVWHPKRRGGAYTKGLFCHVTASGDLPGDIRASTETYAAWWNALDAMRRQLQSARLTMFSVITAMPPPVRKPRRRLD